MYNTHICMHISMYMKEHTIHKPRREWDWEPKERECEMRTLLSAIFIIMYKFITCITSLNSEKELYVKHSV